MANTTYGAVKRTTLTAIADSIRAKTGDSGLITPDQMAESIGNISVGVNDITWARELVDEWDFTESLISKINEIAFIISGNNIDRDSSGLHFRTNGVGSTVYSDDFHTLVDDWTKVDFEFEVEAAVGNNMSRQAFFSVWAPVKNAYSCCFFFEAIQGGFKWIYTTNVNPTYNFTSKVSASRNICLNFENASLYCNKAFVTGNFDMGSNIQDSMTGSNNRFYIGSSADWVGNPDGYVFKKFRVFRHLSQ